MKIESDLDVDMSSITTTKIFAASDIDMDSLIGIDITTAVGNIDVNTPAGLIELN